MRTAAPPTPPRLQTPTNVAYLGEASIVVRGRHTGLTYVFGGRGAVLVVDGRDVPGLLQAPGFTLT